MPNDPSLKALNLELASIDRELSRLEREQRKNPPPPQAKADYLSAVSGKPLTWLWPGRIPFGHLTLLDAAPGSGLSLVAITLAACVSSGSPLPGGTPTRQGNVILLAPYDSAADTIRPRLEAAGGNPHHVLLFRPLVENPSQRLDRGLSFALPQNLGHLAVVIRELKARLVIIDPAAAIPGLSRCLPALIDLAHQTGCAILLTRSLREPPSNPLHAPGTNSPLLEAARSRLLLAPDPANECRHLLLTTRHPLCKQPDILAYDILASEAGIPTIHWLGEHDRLQLTRLSTGPLRSPQRQAILHFLQNSASPRSHSDILKAACYDDSAGRKMIFRMRVAGELVCTARGLYTTPNHPCLLQPTADTPPVSDVPNVPNVPPSQSPPPATSQQGDPTPTPAVPVTDHLSVLPDTSGQMFLQGEQSHAPSVGARFIAPQGRGEETVPDFATSIPQSDVPDVPITEQTTDMLPPVPDVPNVPNSAHSSSEVAHQQLDASPDPDASDEASSFEEISKEEEAYALNALYLRSLMMYNKREEILKQEVQGDVISLPEREERRPGNPELTSP